MHKLNRELLENVKRAFVPQPGGAAEPVAGAGPMTAAAGSPVGGDPSQGGDPNAAAGGDPNAQQMPPAGLDPAMAGMMGGAPQGGQPPMQGSSTLTLSVDDLIKLFKVFQKNSGAPAAAPAAAPAPAAPTAGSDPRVDQMWQMMQSVMNQGGGEGEAQ